MSRLLSLALLTFWPSVIAYSNSAPDLDRAGGSRVARPMPSPTECRFVENRGQWPDHALFVARAGGVLVRAEHDGLALRLPGRSEDEGFVVWMRFEGASLDALVIGEDPLEGHCSFFLGNDPACWRSGVPAFARLRWRELYEGIDLVVRVQSGSLKYDLELAPGADLSAVKLRSEGLEAIGPGAIAHLPGETWQVAPDGQKIGRALRLLELGEERIAFEVLQRDPLLATRIDPFLVWATYLGGSNYNQSPGDIAWGVCFGPGSGDVYAVGETEGANFPQTPGAFQQNPGVGADTFVTRLRSSDGALVYSCVLGGSHQQERGLAVDVDSLGRATVVGITFSSDFPVTPGALDTVKGPPETGFALRLSSSGAALEYSTFLEGVQVAEAAVPASVHVFESGAAVIGGSAGAPDLPFPPGSADPTFAVNEGFVLQLDPTGSFVEWGTYLGGSSQEEVLDIAVASDGTVLAAGRTISHDFPTTPGAYDTTPPTNQYRAFVTRLNSNGSAILWSTLFGGSQHMWFGEYAYHVASLPNGDVVFGGLTDSMDFPATPGAFQTTWQSNQNGFVARLDASGAALRFATYLTSPATNLIEGFAVDPGGVVSMVGQLGIVFPTTSGAWAPSPPGNGNMVVLRLHPSGERLLYASYFGGSASEDWPFDLALAPGGKVAVAGLAFGSGFPTTAGSAGESYAGGQADAIVALLELSPLGTTSVGAPTPSCRGLLEMQATARPIAGSDRFGAWCSGAAPNARGYLLVGFPAPAPQSVLGAEIFVDLAQGFVRVPLVANGDGFAETALRLPASAVGLELALQCVFFGTPGCGSPAELDASQGLRVQVE